MQSGAGQLIRPLCTFFSLCAFLGAAGAEPRLRETSRLVWRIDASWFGGISGLELSDGGTAAILITDRGSLVTARIGRENDALKRVDLLTRNLLASTGGTPFRGKSADAEGLALGAGGTLFVSFEHRHRVMRFEPSGRAVTLPAHPDFIRFGENAGLEALALHPDGRLFCLPEELGSGARMFPLYAFDGQAWQITARIPARGPFLPVGADFDASGRLYLLERATTPLGFRSRIRRFDLNPALATEEELFRSTPGRYDNLEAIALWQDPAGQQRVTVIADDNFLPIQRTQIVDFVLEE
ncbi:MAG: esterase-like activity of phytase family protein [Pseudomonadota bacterium]